MNQQRYSSNSSALEQIPVLTQLADLARSTEWLNGRQQEMLQLVVELCNINSGTYNLRGLAAVTDILQREFNSLGGDMRLLDVDPLAEINNEGIETKSELGKLLHIRRRPDTRPRVLLCIHMDTVYQAAHPFQQCRSISDERINGPGVADAKGGLVVMLYALKAFERSELANQLGWEVIINPDEELGSPGSESFLKSRAAEADVGLLFEPSLPNDTFVSWRKGVGNFAFVVRGRSVHSGRHFADGRNAVVACCRLMSEIHDLNGDPDVTFNVGRIRGGHALNVVPELAIGRVNVRVKTIEKMEQVELQLAQLAARYGKLDGISVELSGRFTSPPKQITEQIELLQKRIEFCGRALDQTIKWMGTGGASDGNKFAAAGLPNVDTLGPAGGDIHSENEFLVIESLSARARLTALILLSLALSAHSQP